jgi:lactate permease
MGKMVAPQSVGVTSTATGCYGQEGDIICFVILHSIALACLIGLLVSVVVRSPPLTRLLLQELSTIEQAILTTHGRPNPMIN